MYRALEVALLRASAHTGTHTVRPWPDLDATPVPVEAWRSWICDTWADQQLAEAVHLANPAYAARVEEVVDGRAHAPRTVHKAGRTLVRYLLRQHHRATPFGLFAGIAPVRIGRSLEGAWGSEHRAVARPDARWLAEVLDQLEHDPELLLRLLVTTEQTCTVRGDQLVVPLRRPGHRRSAEAPSEVALRHTGPVRTIVEAAQQPIRLDHLAELVLDAHPGSNPQQAHRMLTQLVHHGVLITHLRPPMTARDPLKHVLEQLTEAETESIPVAPLVDLLSNVHRGVVVHNLAPSREQRQERTRLRRLAGGTDRPPLAVDLQLGIDLAIPHAVAREAESAAALLAQASPHPTGPPTWRDYYVRFLERYGVGATVPLLDLVNPDTGLGFPAGYRTSALELPLSPVTARDKKLAEVAQLAVLDAASTLELTDVLPGFDTEPTDHLPPHLDLCVQIHATSRQHLNDRDFRLVVTGLAQGAGTTIGRFLHLPHADLRRLADGLRDAPTLTAGARRAQVSCPPLWTGADNVARAPRILDDVITIAQHEHGSLPLRDLLVTADARRMRLLSRTTGQVIEPSVFNAVEPVNFTHPLARFLTELPRARAAVLAPFSWGPLAEALPVLPAVRQGRITLAAARWRLSASDFPTAPWNRALDEVRNRMRIPTHVDLGDGDQRLRLDLDQRAHRQLLHAHLSRTGTAVLRQAPDPKDLGWADGRAVEIVLPLVSLAEPEPMPAINTVAVAAPHTEYPFASPARWAFAKVHAQPTRHAAILARLPELLVTLGRPDCWFVPYRDPDPHLRLRIRAGTVPVEDLASKLATWAGSLHADGLAGGRLQWDTYLPETGRYGTGPLLDRAEAVFVTDSTTVLAQHRHTGPGRLHPQALTAASLLDLAAAFTGGVPTGTAWLAEHLTRTTGEPALDRAVLAQALRLADPTDAWAGLRAETGTDITHAWAARRTAVHAYRAALRTHPGPAPDSVLASLLHMHHIRTAGIDPACEHTCQRIARATALALTHRHQGHDPR
ncbi:lantibiotic dehydratase [Kitasatospora sp. NPDC101183]|uniref:lantibiotic dehydratase n=1 Tax=Kitasatospora sp. NPDC101183 TaxID=3364100 RepID=UPI0038228CB2